MEWTIIYDEQKALVKVTVTGTIVAQRTAAMAIEGIKFARERNCYKFLIDYTLADVGDSTIDTYQFMAGLKSLGITHQDSIGIVYAKDRKDHYFAETVAVNRGWENIKYFLDVEEAANWLLARKVEG